MKRILVSVFLLSACSVFAQTPLQDFNELMAALRSGKHVKMIADYKKCQLIADNEIMEKVPDATGGMSIDTWEYFAKGSVRNDQAFVTFSANHFIQYPGGEGYVYNYVKVRVNEDGHVKITARYIDPRTFENRMDENFFCAMGKNDGNGGVTFFVAD